MFLLMKSKKPLWVRIVIWICVIFMVVSLIWVYVVYMFSPSQEVGENVEWTDVSTWSEEVLALPEIDPENPESTSAPIVVSEDEEDDEMDQTVELQLENGEMETVREWDLWDAIQVD